MRQANQSALQAAAQYVGPLVSLPADWGRPLGQSSGLGLFNATAASNGALNHPVDLSRLDALSNEDRQQFDAAIQALAQADAETGSASPRLLGEQIEEAIVGCLPAYRKAAVIEAASSLIGFGIIERGALCRAGASPLHYLIARLDGSASAEQRALRAVFTLLLEHGADHEARDNQGLTPLFWAVQFGEKECLNALIAAGADLNAVAANPLGGTPLHAAAQQAQRADVVALLCAAGVAVDAVNALGQSPLQVAVEHGQIAAVIALIGAGASIDHVDHNGCTALHSAASQGFTDILQTLLQAGACIDAANAHGMTPLHLAAANGKLPVIDCLINASADLDAISSTGETPLHCAARAKCADTFDRLFFHGAMSNWADDAGHTAFDLIDGVSLAAANTSRLPSTDRITGLLQAM